MNYKTLQELVAILNSLPGFEHYGYANESITDYKRDEDEEIVEICFECGHLKRTWANARSSDVKGLYKKETWVLGYDAQIVGVFIIE